MIKIERTYKYYCCNLCGKQDSESFPIHIIKIGIDGSNQTIGISFCNECLKKLKAEVEAYINNSNCQ